MAYTIIAAYKLAYLPQEQAVAVLGPVTLRCIVNLRTSVRVSFRLYTAPSQRAGVRLQPEGAPKYLFPTQCYVVLD